MVTAEESVFGEDDVLPIDPVILIIIIVAVFSLIDEIHISSPRPERLRWDCNFVRKKVVAPLGSKSASKAHERHLNGRRTCCKYLVPCTSSIAIEVDENVDAVSDDPANQAIY